MFNKKRKNILVLGGGGARGLSNIGVLKVLNKYFPIKDKPFDMVIGTSIGSLIGAAYCLGVTPEEMEKEALSFTWQNVVDFAISSTGMVKGNKFEKIINEMVSGKNFEDMKIPFALTTTDLETGEAFVYTSGDLIKLIRASCSWPGTFAAVKIYGGVMVDGGLRNSIPTKIAKRFDPTFMLAVNPGFAIKNHKVDNVLKALVQSVQIMGEELNSYQSRLADLTIKPKLINIDQFDFNRAKEIITQGERATEKKMKVIKKGMKGLSLLNALKRKR
jgi:NTE family protein